MALKNILIMLKAAQYILLFWYEYLLNPKRYDYNVKFVQDIDGLFDIKTFKKVLNLFVKNHGVFNYHFQEHDNQLFWVQNKTIDELALVDNSKKAIDAFLNAPFELEKGPLYRFGVVVKDKDQYKILIVLHHALISGSQYPSFINTLSAYYQVIPDQSDFKLETLSELTQKYEDKIKQLKQNNTEVFWRQYIPEEYLTNEVYFPKSDKLPKVKATYFKISKDGNIDFGVMFLVWGLLLSKYTLSGKYIIKYPLSISEGDKLGFGAWINSIPFQISYSEEETFYELYERYQKSIQSLSIDKELRHSYLPTPDISSFFKSHEILEGFAQTRFAFRDCELNFPGCEVSIDMDLQLGNCGEHLCLEYEDAGTYYLMRMIYDENCFSRAWVESLAEQYQLLLKNCLEEPKQSLSEICVLSPNDYQKVIDDWNQTEHPFPESTLHELFTKQAKETPNNTALVYEGQTLTYQELDAQSNQLARRIQEHNPSPLIALCLERSLEMVIAILATLKAGCAYVPMDPDAPLARIRHMLADTKTNLVLTQSVIKHDFNVTRIDLDQHDYQDQSKEKLKNHTKPQDLAYVIYTSGTTGLPKGVMVEHRNILNTLYAYDERLILAGRSMKIAQACAYTFDTSCLDFSLAWYTGSELHVLTKVVSTDIMSLGYYLKQHQIEYIELPTALYQLLSECDKSHLASLRFLVCGGEKLVSPINNEDLQFTFVNTYGPTEASVESQIAIYPPSLPHGAINGAWIGKPIANTSCYILDRNRTPLPIGAIGELYIGGAGVARGYLNQEKLTQERFIQNPFTEGRLYKTGDLVRYLADGNIEYIGRNDFQVKIRGFRIELGEIEARLAQYPGITQASVQYYTEPKPILAAYYVSPIPIIDADLQAYLASSLPDYMLPNSFTYLEKLPLTVNGKLDRKALPIPTFKTEAYVAPRNELEASIANIWQELLQVEKVGITDDFFKLGGNSILAIQLIYRLKVKLSIHFQVTDIFKYRTIGALLMLSNHGQSESQLFHKLTSNQDVGQTIYLLHPGFAHSSDSYHAFVEKADGLVNLFGFEHYFLKDESIKIATFEEWARYYVSFMQHHLDKSKEMIFLGWSLGGNLAIEMAHLLEAQGYENIKLYLLDTMVQKAPKDGQLLSRLAIKHEIIKSLGEDYCFNIPKEAMNKMIDFGVLFNNIILSTIHPRVLKKTKGVLFRADKDKKGCSEDNGLQRFFENRLQIFQIEETHYAIINAVNEIWDIIIQNSRINL